MCDPERGDYDCIGNAITATGEKPLSPAMLRELSMRCNWRGLVRAASHYGVIFVVGTLIWLVSSRYGIVWALPLVVVQGYFVAFLFMVVHETAHKTAFHSRALNLAFGHLSSFAVGLPYEYYCPRSTGIIIGTRRIHRGTPELLSVPIPTSDAQLVIVYSGLRQVAFRARLMLRHALTGNATSPWIPEGKRHIIVREARLYLAAYVALLLASVALHTLFLLWVWVVPVIVGQLFLRPYLLAEHTGCDRTRSAFQNTRTTYTGMFVRWFAWNMPYHVEHHAYPSIPFHALPKLNGIVADQIVYRGPGYIAVTRQTWAWFRRARNGIESPIGSD